MSLSRSCALGRQHLGYPARDPLYGAQITVSGTIVPHGLAAIFPAHQTLPVSEQTAGLTDLRNITCAWASPM